MTPVLIVEDEDLVAKTLGRWLGACGYDLAYAANAQDAVTEALEAMTHAEPYRPARSPVEVAVELRRCAGTQFDAKVVARVLEVMATG